VIFRITIESKFNSDLSHVHLVVILKITSILERLKKANQINVVYFFARQIISIGMEVNQIVGYLIMRKH
jgi:hypothetical protein